MLGKRDRMAYAKYELNGKSLLNLNNIGMVDYDEYYLMWSKSMERRNNIADKYISIQNTHLLQNEPGINYSVLYKRFLEELKSTNLELYNQKLMFYNEFKSELNAEEKMFDEEKRQLLIKGYPFDKSLKKYGYYIVKIDDDYYQYKWVTGKTKVDMGDRFLPQNAIISGYRFVPLTIEELQEIKLNITNSGTNGLKRFR